MENVVKCPKCGSTQLSASKKGFSGKNAVAGAVLTGGIGFLAGTIGSNKIIVTCLACGHQHKAGDYQMEKVKLDSEKKALSNNSEGKLTVASIFVGFFFLIITIVVAYFSYLAFSGTFYILGVALCLISLLSLYMVYTGVVMELNRFNLTNYKKKNAKHIN